MDATGEILNTPPTQTPDSQADLPKPPPAPDISLPPITGLPGTEIRPEEITFTLHDLQQAFDGKNGAVDLVKQAKAEGVYDTDDEARRRFADAHKVKSNDLLVNEEMIKREDILKALSTLERAKKGRPITDSKGQVFEVDVLDEKGQPTGRKERIRTQRAQWVVLEELINNISQQTESAADGKSQEPTARAKRAKEVLNMLEPRIEKYQGAEGTECYIVPDLNAHKEKKAREQVISLGWNTLETFLKQLGGIPKLEDGQIDLKAVRELAKKTDPKTSLGRLMVFLVSQAESSNNPKTDRFISALVYHELTNLIKGDFASQNSQLVKELAGLSQETFRAYLENIAHFILDKAGYDPTKAPIGFTFDKLARDVTVALLIEDFVTTDMQGRYIIEEPYKGKKPVEKHPSINLMLDTLEKDGVLTAHDRHIIMSLAGQKIASDIFKSLGVNPENLKRPDCAQYFANKAIGILQTIMGDRLNPETASEYSKILTFVLEEGIAHYAKSLSLGNWVKVMGLLALIFGPSLSEIFKFGVEEEREQRQS